MMLRRSSSAPSASPNLWIVVMMILRAPWLSSVCSSLSEAVDTMPGTSEDVRLEVGLVDAAAQLVGGPREILLQRGQDNPVRHARTNSLNRLTAISLSTTTDEIWIDQRSRTFSQVTPPCRTLTWCARYERREPDERLSIPDLRFCGCR